MTKWRNCEIAIVVLSVGAAAPSPSPSPSLWQSSSNSSSICRRRSLESNSLIPMPRSAMPGFRIHHRPSVSGDATDSSKTTDRSQSSSAHKSSRSSANEISMSQVLGTAVRRTEPGCFVEYEWMQRERKCFRMSALRITNEDERTWL